MEFKKLSSDGKVTYLIRPILKVLQEAGGQLERSEIKERISDLDDQIVTIGKKGCRPQRRKPRNRRIC